MSHVAYGVEPDRRATYELRQSRYQALGEDVVAEVRRIQTTEKRRVKLLDVGVYDGVSRRYIEAYSEAEQIDFEAVDLYPNGPEFVYKHDQWKLHEFNLLGGMPGLETDCFDIVICEQVLEHLPEVQPAIQDLVRVLKPGGLLIVGVPIFPEGAHLFRKHCTPVLDKLLKVKKIRGHVQAWSLRTFMKEWQPQHDLQIENARGFRIISGGVLRPLEFSKIWWKMNRAIGSVVPGLCTEVQLLGRKATKAA
ncbi:MAG: class I SAM-dependent methyltransferase [Pirellulaceae bacterium]|nr:class I SAM-dependent methyltransferase [Pirellulaceae bacterium]